MVETSDLSRISHRLLVKLLQQLQIDLKIYYHPPLPTVAAAKEHRGIIEGLHLKNLFLRDNKEKMWLVVAPEDQKIDLKELEKKLGCGRLSFGSAERLEKYLAVRPGSVSPLAVINDPECHVQAIFDEQLLDHPVVTCHPLQNDITLSLPIEGLLKFMEAAHHPPRFLK